MSLAKKAKYVRIRDLTPDAANANKGTRRGRDLLEHSLEQLGAGRSILIDKHGRVIAGNKTFAEWGQLHGGDVDVLVVRTNGQQLVAVMREDLDLETDGRARELAIADNRVGQVDLDWDIEQLLGAGIPLETYFSEEELDRLKDKAVKGMAVEGESSGGQGKKEHECPNCGHRF